MLSRRITIVEDDENIAGLLGFLFRREGFAPDVLRDGRAALEHLSGHAPPAAVLLDQMLPYRDGLSVASAMRANARWSGVPIVLISGAEPAPEALVRGRDRLVDAFVSKPFHPDRLVAAVRRLVDGPP